MKSIFTRFLLVIIMVLASFVTKAQLPYSETFGGSCNTSFPGNWTTADPDWIIDDNSTTCFGGVPECNVVGSSGGSMMAGADGSSGLETTVTASVNASAFTNLTLDWNGYRSTGAPAMTVEYSFDNSSFTSVAFTDVATDDQWHAVTTVNLPAACDNAPVLYIRFSYTGTAAGAFIAIDDIVLNGTSLTTFYWNGTGALHQTTSWGAFPNGTGPNPLSFTAAGQTFNLYNNTAATFNAALTAPWAVSGGTVFLNLGNGTTINTNLTIPAGSALSLTNATLNVNNSSTLTIQNTTFPAAGNVSVLSGSTIDFAQAAPVTLWNKTYHNLTISGGANKTQNGNTTINGVLNLASATSNFSMVSSPLLNLILNGSITGTGSILTGNTRVTIGGSGVFGTIRFGVGATNRTINNLTVNRPSGDITLGSNLTVNGSAALTNGTININSNNLTFNGAVTFPVAASNGVMVGSTTSTLNILNTGAVNNSLLMDQTSATTSALRDLTFSRSGGTLNLGNPLNIWGTITPSVGTIASGSNLTIKSDASNKGRVGIIGASASLTGNPTVEVFKKAGLTNWINLCSGGVIGGNMAGWNSSFAITCLTCPDGTQVGGVTFTSIYTYDETTFVGDETNALHYVEITALTGINSNEGYWVFIGNGFPNTTAITIPLQGSGVNTKNSASWNLSLTGGVSPNNGWHLIANPFPAPISVANMLSAMGTASANIDNTFFVYDSNLETNVPFSASGSNSVIPMGQAFSVRSLQNGLSFSSNESWKLAGTNNSDVLKMNAATPYFWDDFLLDVTSTSFSKPFFANAYFTFDPAATTGFDNGKDAYFTGNSVNPGLPVIYSTTGSQKFLRNALPSLGGTVTIPITVNTATAGVFQITGVNFNKLPAGACVTLYNIANATSHNLKSGPYTATVSANVTTPQYELRITVNPGTLSSNVNNPLCKKGNNGSVIAQGTSTSGPWNYTWKDASNNVIKTSLNKSTADTLLNVGVGNYQVDVNTVGSCDNANASFVLNSTAPLPASAFTVNFDTLNVNGTTQFVFTNNSTNADTYSWHFGDGNTSAQQNPSYMYSTAGNYNVSLYAINSTCADSSMFTYQVHAVNSPTLSGVLAYQNLDNTIKVGKDARGIYVDLAFDKSTKATISVNNILGQVLISPMNVETTTERYYLDLNAKEQIVFVTVTTTEKRFTQKIFHNQ
ncbi:MAG: PKD domain-containing protein [Bacteroidetes bacterium]|nr:PKD domain-containing protein [Bacteroidota bacterium]